MIDGLGVFLKGTLEHGSLSVTDDVHFHREHLLHFHADGQVVRAVLGDGGVDAGVAPDLADDTQRRALCGFADRIGKLLLENAGSLASLFGDGVQGFSFVGYLLDVPGRDHLVESLAQLEVAKAFVTPGR